MRLYWASLRNFAIVSETDAPNRFSIWSSCLVRRSYSLVNNFSLTFSGSRLISLPSLSRRRVRAYFSMQPHKARVNLKWVESEGLVGDEWQEKLAAFDGILVPGGFGPRGIEGMIRAIRHARANKIPYFGICLGMQCAVIEFARNVCSLEANSSEFDSSTQHRLIYKLRELLGVEEMGGTMRLGAYPCELETDSLAFRIYGEREISERHRHRYEFNREYEELLTSYGLRIAGNSPDRNFVEIVELADHPWFLACQFHPEFKSKPLKPHPLFVSFIEASLEYHQKKEEANELSLALESTFPSSDSS